MNKSKIMIIVGALAISSLAQAQLDPPNIKSLQPQGSQVQQPQLQNQLQYPQPPAQVQNGQISAHQIYQQKMQAVKADYARKMEIAQKRMEEIQQLQQQQAAQAQQNGAPPFRK